MVTNGTVRWGLLGTARINQALIPPIRASARSDLVAVASRSLERARAYAQENQIPRAFGSYKDLLAAPDVDAIYLSLPNSLHVPWSLRALQAGKHVLCEKPLALEEEDIDQLEAAASASGVTVAEAFMYRHHPQTLRVQELVASGALGQLVFIRGSFSFPLSDPTDIRLRNDLGGGSIWDIGCYPISYVRLLVGAEPEQVFGWQVSGKSGVDEVFVGQMRFPNGVLGQFDSSFRLPERMEMEIVGTNGVIHLTEPFKPGLEARIYLQRGGKTEVLSVPSQELYLGEVEDMADVILHGKNPRVPLADSRGTVATIRGLLRSAQTGQPVLLSPRRAF